jgi:hypothetical protein
MLKLSAIGDIQKHKQLARFERMICLVSCDSQQDHSAKALLRTLKHVLDIVSLVDDHAVIGRVQHRRLRVVKDKCDIATSDGRCPYLDTSLTC